MTFLINFGVLVSKNNRDKVNSNNNKKTLKDKSVKGHHTILSRALLCCSFDKSRVFPFFVRFLISQRDS